MADYVLESVDLTGRWVGFYRHRWERLGTYPIIAQIQQAGYMISGEMYDQITDRSDYLEDYLDVIGGDITAEARYQMQLMIRRFGTDTVQNVRLPDTSDIQGKITGDHVEFTKTYRGAVETNWTVEDMTVASYRRDGHQVQYSGHLDFDRMCLTGRWTIRQRGLLGRFLPPRAWGSFELYRKS